MVNGNCAVVGCSNSCYNLKKWEKQDCKEHSGEKKDCTCKPPFSLHWFPSSLKNTEKRKGWIRLMNRTSKRGANWTPGQSDMVCSKHFVDRKPTSKNPMPTLNLGYEKPMKVPQRKLLRESPPDYYCLSEICGDCSNKNKVLNSMASEISKLNKEKEQLQIEIQSCSFCYLRKSKSTHGKTYT